MGICFFSGLEAKITSLSKEYDGHSISVTFKERTYEYWINREVALSIPKHMHLNEIDKLKILNEIITQNNSSTIPYFVWDKNYVSEKTQIRPFELGLLKLKKIDHKYKEDLILKKISEKLKDSNPFSQVSFHLFDIYELNIADFSELYEWYKSLAAKGMIILSISSTSPTNPIHTEKTKSDFLSHNVKLTSKGWDKIYSGSLPSNSRDVFIAMAFTDQSGADLSSATGDAIKRACFALNWNPVIVNEVPHNDGIMDKVIGLINESHFVIADLTYQKSGVYYEAGYAKSKGLQVIHCVNEAEKNNCHFDVRHLNLIIWKDHSELEAKLIHRIKATIGAYPEKK